MTRSLPARAGRLALAAAAALALASCGSKNSDIPTLQAQAQTKWQAVEAAYRARAQLVPDLTPAMQGAPDDEQELLSEVMDAKKRAISAQVAADDLDQEVAMDIYVQAQSQLVAAIDHFVMKFDDYPNLDTVASSGYLDQQIGQSNIDIHAAIIAYNAAARRYNEKITHFPASLEAKVVYNADPYIFFRDSATDPS
jgi:LemA protein